MNKKELMMFAVDGIYSQIEKREKVIRKGEKLLQDIRNGKPRPSVKLNVKEIIELINGHRKKVEELDSKMSDLNWELSMMDEGVSTVDGKEKVF